MPPRAAMYWSCLPMGLPQRSISMLQARSASSSADTLASLVGERKRVQQADGDRGRRSQA